MASTLSIAPDDVFVTSVSDYTFGVGVTGRRLLAAGVNIAFAIETDTSDNARALVSSIGAVESSSAGLVSSLQAKGLSLDASSVELTQRPAFAAKTPLPPGVVLPVVSIITVSPVASLVNPAAQITLSAAVKSSAPASSLVLLWSVVPAAALNLSDSSRVGTALGTTALGLLPGALSPGVSYAFRLSVHDAFGHTSSSMLVTTMSVPTGGLALASSANGTELQTHFVLSTANWTDAYLPLQYSFSYTSLNNSVDGMPTSTLLADFSNSTSVSGFLLPAGTIELQVWARNALGGVSLAPATITVVVARQVFASAAAQASFISLLVSNTTGGAGLYTYASVITTVALVSSIADILNDPNSQLSSNATAAAETRASLLSVISSTMVVAGTPEALASAADAVGLLVGNSSQISPTGAATALGVLQFISKGGPGGNVTITPAASAGVAASLSSIASAALDPASPVSLSVLTVISNVVGSLATALLSSLTTPGAAPVTVNSPLIQMSVALDLAGPESRLFSAPLTAPGSKSSFSPLPADIFAGLSRRRRLLADAGVRTQFSCLAFDPHTLDANSTGTTTLAFSTAAGELNISGLSTPIRFTLPMVPLADGFKAQCQFWDSAALNYSIVGCVGLPDPLPRGHNVSWRPSFTVASDAAMAGAWSITGPLVAAPSRCLFEVLDCAVANNTRSVYPNPAKPFQFPAVSCNASISTEPILVISGNACALIQEDNAFGCFWNNSKHSFQGPGCVASGEPVQCACRHLTEFTGRSAPSLPTASLSDMLSLNPADIVSKLKLLFEVVIILFGIMNVGAAVGGVMDRRERHSYLEKLQQPRMGYRMAEDGAWLWSFSVDPMQDIIDAPTGPAVEICELLGIPVARLRFALPDELLSWDMATALGRIYGMSRSGWESAAVDLKEKLPSFFGSFRRSRSSRMSQMDPAVVAEAERAHQDMIIMEEFVGTCIVLAFLQVAALMPVVQLAERSSAAARHFDGVRTAFGRDFSTTRVDFITLLSPGILNINKKWLPRARLWRLILSQNESGFWDASTTTALVLEARSSDEVDEVPKTFFMKVMDMLRNLTESVAHAEAAGDDAGAAAGRHEQSNVDEMYEMRESSTFDHAGEEVARVRRNSQPRPLANDCPLNCSVGAINTAMPPALSKLRKGGQLFSAVKLRRVWTTLCCIAVLERLNVCWISGDGDLYAPVERTIVDAAREWIEAQAADWPLLAAALEDGTVMNAARKTTRNWNRAWEQRVVELRTSPALRQQMGRSHVHRTAIGLTRALVAKNDTCRTFMAEPLDGLQRWQMFMILVTLIISQLLVNIWMFYAKAVNCCSEVVAILDSGPDGGNCATPADCRGFTGNCADIVNQFADLPVLPDFPDGMADYTCSAFPNDDNPVDSFIVGLISIAIALPASLFLASCFMISNDSEAPESWLEWYGWRKFVFGTNAHRRWHYTGPLGQPNRHVKWFIRSVGAPPTEVVINLWHSLRAWVTGTDPPWVEEWREAVEEGKAEADAEPDAPACDSHIVTASLHEVNLPVDAPRVLKLHHRAERDAFDTHACDTHNVKVHEADPSHRDGDGASTTSSVRSARALARYKHIIALTGFVGVYVTWALFAWFIFVYGMLIYKLLGEKAQSEFARSWGVSYGMNTASEWKDVMIESLKGMFILAILERLYITRTASWFEDHVDYCCIQSQLFSHPTMNVYQQTRLLWRHTKRISDD